MKNLILLFWGILIVSTVLMAVTIHIPGDYPTIQAGIDASQNGDTILVAQGTYNEQIFFRGKEIVVKSENGPNNTIIDPNMVGCAVNFIENEGPGAVIEGFTITNSYFGSTGWYSGVKCLANTYPTIRDNIISQNGGWWAYFGGGIHADSSYPIIENNKIIDNASVYYGGGIYIIDCDTAIVRNNFISGNIVYSGYGVAHGGGIYAANSNVLIEKNFIIDNTADINYAYGGGISLEFAGNYAVINNTIAGNHGKGVYLCNDDTVDFKNNILVNTTSGGGMVNNNSIVILSLDFNDVWNNLPYNYAGCEPGRFDISQDPLFLPGPEHNFYLNDDSPCIDAASYQANLDPDGTRADIGAQYHNQENINTAITPLEWPIIIPPGGGDFDCILSLTNNIVSPQGFDFWVEALLPDSTIFGPIILRQGLQFQPYFSTGRGLTQAVPASAPPGTYKYRAISGNFSTQEIFYQAELPFIKTAGFSGE